MLDKITRKGSEIGVKLVPLEGATSASLSGHADPSDEFLLPGGFCFLTVRPAISRGSSSAIGSMIRHPN
jgi:hypothetical protein